MAKTAPKPETEPVVETAPAAGGVAGKGHATPTRREREAARRRPLVPNDRAEARRQDRARVSVERERARVGMANGEERYLPARDKGPQRRFVRDYVDARFSVAELTIPLMVVVIILTFVQSAEVQAIGLVAMWAFLVIALIDVLVVGQLLTRRLRDKFGADKVERIRWYAGMRAFQFRPLRMPKPQVKRRQFPA